MYFPASFNFILGKEFCVAHDTYVAGALADKFFGCVFRLLGLCFDFRSRLWGFHDGFGSIVGGHT